jgi:hypothetical protein
MPGLSHSSSPQIESHGWHMALRTIGSSTAVV